jgi:hypothetical protein
MGKDCQQNLVRHKSPSLLCADIRQQERNLEEPADSYFSVAKARLAEFLREYREKQVAAANQSSAKITFAEALAIHLQNLADDTTITPERAPLLEQVFTSLLGFSRLHRKLH